MGRHRGPHGRSCRPTTTRCAPWTAVELEGRRVGAIVHDVTLCEDPEMLRSVAAAAGLAMENERLQAQLRARVEELRASRARIVEAGTHERRRLERNLHDGAQQRLVALSLTLRLAQSKLRTRIPTAPTSCSTAPRRSSRSRSASCASSPAASTRRSCPIAGSAPRSRRSPAARRSRSSSPTCPPSRCREPIEAAAYFVVAEALTNVVKYAHASQATRAA